MSDVRRLASRSLGYLTTPAAARHLGLSPRTLEKYRTLGGGPRFHKFGKAVRYDPDDLDAWAADRAAYMTSDPEYLALRLVPSNRTPGGRR